jgi:hypothetical protein
MVGCIAEQIPESPSVGEQKRTCWSWNGLGKNADIFRNDLSCSTSSLAYQSRDQLVSRKDLSVEMQPIKQVQERFCGQSQR